MSNFEKLLEDMGMKEVENTNLKYPYVGKIYNINNEYINGNYWFYETDRYCFDIHDFKTKNKDFFKTSSEHFSKIFPIVIYYVIDGEWINIGIENKSKKNGKFILMNLNKNNFEFLIDKNTRLYCVSFALKHKFIKETMSDELNFSNEELDSLFNDNEQINKDIEKIAKEIINCKLKGISAKLFLDAKAKEWLSIYVETFYNKDKKYKLSKDDDIYLEKVIKYIDSHYMFNIPHIILEKIACMSSTNLKKKFKEKYYMSITEYIQRYRINMGENLIKNTNLDLKNISISVGYKNHSRFTFLFKKYKCTYPKDIRKNKF